MNAEFNWWLLIVGLVIGAGLVYLVLSDSRRREVDVVGRERDSEALWIADTMADTGRAVGADDVLEVLRLHAEYLTAGPPDDLDDETEAGTAAEARVEDAIGGRDPAGARPAEVAGDRVATRRAGDPDRAPMAHPMSRPSDADDHHGDAGDAGDD